MKIGLALSGGGVLGAAHIGVLKALKEANIPISVITGTSSGSIVAALYAAGYSANQLETIFAAYDSDSDVTMHNLNAGKKRHPKIIDIDYWGVLLFFLSFVMRKEHCLKGLLKGDAIEKSIESYCRDRNAVYMSDIKMPLAVPAVDICTAQTVIFSNKPLKGAITDCKIHEAVRASISYPVVFRPFQFRGRQFVDGGIAENIPTDLLRDMGADFVIAIDLGYNGQPRSHICNIVEIAEYSITAITYHLNKTMTDQADYVIHPEIDGVKLLDASKIVECIEVGYQITKAQTKQMIAKMNRLRHITNKEVFII